MKSVMMQLCVYLLGLSAYVLHTVMYFMLFGRVAALVIIGIQVLVAAWIIYIRIRAPD
ncbi:hypothetical protein [Alistipes putredinis]|uniref:hypothetical protein n=1 Tax=Alistipes putredinis TaxID=28117 RepID=UPI003AB374E0